jgi:uridine phosphorylase
MQTYFTQRFMRLPDGRLPHMGVSDGEVAPYVLVSGNPERLERMMKRMDSLEKVGDKRGYVVYTGLYKGVPLSLASTGVGSPSLAIGVEELGLCGGRVFLRVGSCASIQAEVPIGDIILTVGGVRDEGVSHTYAPAIYPAIADPDLLASLREAAREAGVAAHVGLVRSTDSFYEGERKQEIIEQWQALGVLAFEMESSALFTVARVLGYRAGSILVPGTNLITSKATYQGEGLEAYAQGMEKTVGIAMDAMHKLASRDPAD